MSGFGMIYLKRVPTNDRATADMRKAMKLEGPSKKQDVAAFSDPEGKNEIARWCWAYSNKPKRNHKTTMLNCVRYNITWIKETPNGQNHSQTAARA